MKVTMFLESEDIIIHRKGALPLSIPNLSIDVGQSTLILGDSGSGKTTLLSVLAGFLKPNEGHVSVRGADLYGMSAFARDRMRGQNFGFVFQALHLIPSLTLAQNITLAADMSGRSPEEGRLGYLLDALGLQGKADRKPATLSQGEQQRASVARAVFMRPKVIIADEPTSALDDSSAQAVTDLLEEQAKDTGAALLIATHDNRIKSRFETVINLKEPLKDIS